MSLRWNVVAAGSDESVIVEGPNVDIRDCGTLRCVETRTSYEVASMELVPADAYAGGHRLVRLRPLDGPFDLRVGMTLIALAVDVA